jgi:hypothetical protein
MTSQEWKFTQKIRLKTRPFLQATEPVQVALQRSSTVNHGSYTWAQPLSLKLQGHGSCFINLP